jgi:hypothetical protein
MNAEARRLLADFYREDVLRLSRLLQRPLPWKNFPEASRPMHEALR